MKGTGKSVKKRKKDSDFKKNVVFNIQSIIMSVLMAITLVTIVTMGFLLYQRFKLAIDKMAVSNTEATVESTVDRVNSDLLDIRQIFNAANYNIVQEFDISSEKFAEQFSLLYEVNSDKIESLALYGNEGRLIASEPVAVEKENIDVTGQDWYKNAESAIENVHFSVPHIQNLYEDGLYRYHWVVSLSRYVDINDGESPGSGVLLVDMKYSVIEDVLKQINDSSEGIYYYMISRDGQMIYHPRKTEMARGLFEENSLKASGYEEGTYEITTDGHKESVVVGNIAYTGWKLIGVVPESVQTARINNFRYYIFTTIMVLMMMLLEGNRLISRKISKPIRKLDKSVKTYEAGGKPDIYIGGSSEIRHLGYSVQRSYERIETLMEEIIRQQNERRKSELDALQSQINPHFLYNTLESITWMVEAQKNEEAVIMISELAKLLRVSLSRGKTIIPVKDELQHSRSYMNIQLVRYKERFQMEFQTDKEIEDYCIVKLVIQPILENAIYYGVGNMDEDDEGKITVRGEKKEDDIYITIEDNGMGMRKEVLENILKDNNKVPKHGSGVGVINVHSRIQLMFGEQYGLEIYSEPDEGTRVVIHIPAIPYTKENAEQLEMQKYTQGRDVDEKE
jgi:sensor histidine kinase YesM